MPSDSLCDPLAGFLACIACSRASRTKAAWAVRLTRHQTIRRAKASIGEDITETLEAIPRQWKVIQTVREKFTCRDCEKISQTPAPFHPTPRGWAGPNLLAMILFEKYGQHQPLNRQRDRYAREGLDLSCRPWPTRRARARWRCGRCTI